jgi:ABC-type transport system substrate-binding protein
VTAVGRRLPFLLALTLGAAALLLTIGPFDDGIARAGGDEVAVLAGEPTTLDPAQVGDAGSAAVVAQLYEGLTAFDPDLVARPALARSWEVFDGGRRVVFHLRDGLTFSDGTPLTSDDVVRSWLRLVDPAAPSPLVSLLSDVEGALAYARGEIVDPAGVGFRAVGNDVEVRLNRPADIASIVGGPSFGVVPPSLDVSATPDSDAFAGSGGYVIDGLSLTGMVLRPTIDTGRGRPRSGPRASSTTSADGARSRHSPTASWTTPRSAASTHRGSPMTATSVRSSGAFHR